MNDIAITSLISVPVVAACFIVGYIIKNITPLKNKYVPAVVMCTGVIASVILGFVNENEVDTGNILNFIITGAISGLASTGSYEFIMHTLKLQGGEKEENKAEEEVVETVTEEVVDEPTPVENEEIVEESETQEKSDTTESTDE